MKFLLATWISLVALSWYEQGRPPDGGVLIASTIAASVIFMLAWPLRVVIRRRSKSKVVSPLDRVVMTWDGIEPLRVRDLLSGGIAIFGRPGSGKTSTTLRHLLLAILMLGNSGLLILASKPEDRADIEKMVARCGRSKDLRIVEPGGKEKCNFSEAIPTDAADVTKFLMTVSESMKSGDTGGGDKEQFWHQNIERAIMGAAEMCRQAYNKINPSDIYKFIMSAPLSGEQIGDAKWQSTSFFCNTMDLVHKRAKTTIERFDYELYREQWLKEWPVMADKTRSGILAGVNGILHILNSGVVRDMVATETTVSPADLAKGAIIFVDMPIMKYGESARVVLGGWKYITQRWVLQRKANPGDHVVGIIADEAQNVINSFDFFYASESRSHLGFTIYCTQSIHSYRSALRGETGEHLVEGLLTCFLHKVFHVLGDSKSAEYAASLLGRSERAMFGGSEDPNTTAGEELFGRPGFTSSFSSAFEYILQPSVFLSDLKTGGESHGYVAEAYVIRSGEKFSTNENYLRICLSQR